MSKKNKIQIKQDNSIQHKYRFNKPFDEFAPSMSLFRENGLQEDRKCKAH